MDDYAAEFDRLLDRSGWTNARAARELGLTPSVVTQYRKRRTAPSLTVLRLFAEILGERLLLPGESGQHSALRDGPRWLEEWEADALHALRRFEPHRRREVIRAIGTILEAAAGSVSYGRKASRPAEDPVGPTQAPMRPLIDAEVRRRAEAEAPASPSGEKHPRRSAAPPGPGAR